VNTKLDHIVALTQSVSSSTATREIDALIDEACARIRSRTDSKLYLILRFRCFGGASPRMARKQHTRRRCTPNSDTATFAPPWTQITDSEVARMVNQVTNRMLGLGEEVEPGSVQ
jgi:hypothetical protein